MVALDFSVRRVYIAALAAISYVLAYRSLVSHDWPVSRVLGAITADAAILALLFFAFALVDRTLQPRSVAARGHKALHLGIALITVLLAFGAQVLFIKTGEILDIGILAFFLENIHGLAGASKSVIDGDVIFIAIACFGFYATSVFQIKKKPLRIFQYFLLAIPALLLISTLAEDFLNRDQSSLPFREKEFYKGEYADLVNHQMNWLTEGGSSVWRQGILSGLSTVSYFGLTEYQFIEAETQADQIYLSPVTSTPASSSPPNVLFVILESTRADVIGVYEKKKRSSSNTPFLDRLAQNSWLYEHVYTTVPHTSKALVGIYCGTFPKEGTDSFESTTADYPLNCLPRLLEPVNYRTAHFQTAPGSYEGRTQFLKNAGFSHIVVQEDLQPEGNPRYGYLGLDDRLLISPMIKWMKSQKKEGRPFFASMLTVLTHHPYVSPGNVKPVHSPKDAKQDYEKAVRYIDGVLEELLVKMQHDGLLENTVIVITGDHGEAFAEHQQLAHNGVPYEEGMRVPLIIHAPEKLSDARKIKGLRQHIDLLPSILHILDIPYEGILPGKNLFIDSEGHKELITACFYNNYCLNHYHFDGTKFIYFYGKRPSEIYDLRKDPEEKQNLVNLFTEDKLRKRLYRAISIKKSYDEIYPK